MATFTTCVRNKRSDGYYPVYIRLAHKGMIQYLKTDYIIHQKSLSSMYNENGIRKEVITDKFVLRQCLVIIDNYISRINRISADNLTCKELADFLMKQESELLFTEYANQFILDMIRHDRKNASKNYKTAVESFKRSLNKEPSDSIPFSDITTISLKRWIDSLNNTKRAKQMYPNAIKTIFNAALIEYNDYDNNIIRIPNDPFRRIKIPTKDVPTKRSVSKNALRNFLLTKPQTKLEELAIDVANMIISLAGINSADLYDLKESSLTKDWKLKYNRVKTRTKRSDKAYMEIKVPERIHYLFDKYKGKRNLLSFRDKYYDSNQFNKAVNKNLKKVSERTELPIITTYYLRHSWATYAQNKCGASLELVASSLNHASAHKITEGYIEKDFTPISELNQKVIDYIFKRRTKKEKVRQINRFRKNSPAKEKGLSTTIS